MASIGDSSALLQVPQGQKVDWNNTVWFALTAFEHEQAGRFNM